MPKDRFSNQKKVNWKKKSPINELNFIEIIYLQRLTRIELLNDWENNFCKSLLSNNLSLSIKQSSILEKLVKKYKVKHIQIQ